MRRSVEPAAKANLWGTVSYMYTIHVYIVYIYTP